MIETLRPLWLWLLVYIFLFCEFLQDVIPVCEDLYEVKDYPTTAFVFELGPKTDAGLLAR